MIPVRARGERAWNELAHALRTTTPACSMDQRFTLDDLSENDLDLLRVICRRCGIAEACRSYAIEGRPEAGVWAGRRYGPRSPAAEKPPVINAPRPPGANGTFSNVSESIPTLARATERPTAPAANATGTPATRPSAQETL